MGKDNVHYAKALDNLGVIELKFEDYDEAESHVRQAMEIRKEILGDNHSDYLLSLVSMTAILQLKGNYIEARDICEEGLKKTETTNKKQYITFLNFYSYIQSQLGYDTEAECALEKALAIVDKSDTLEYCSLLTAFASKTYDKGEYEKALELYEQVISLEKATKGVESLLYASTLNNICDVLIKLGKFKEADTYLYKAFEVADKKEVSGRSFASHLGTLANLQFALGNFENGIDAAKTALGIRMEQGNGARQDIIRNIENLTDIIYGYGWQNELSYFSYRATSSLNDEILEKFKDMTAIERERFWGKYSSWYMKKLNRYAYSFPNDTLCMAAYNGALMSKGLLLNSEIEMRKLLQKSGEEMALSIYEELRMNKVMLQRLYEKPLSERYVSTDSLEEIVSRLEKHLLKRSKIYGDYTKNLRIDYKDVRGKLKDGDLAIEFCSFPLSKDSTMYMALVLRNDMEYPKMIPLFEEKQISKTSSLLEEMQIGTLRRDIYMGGHTATLVWKPLEQYLNNAKNVYFSPSGELYNIAIENIPHWSEECLMSDKWNIYRLSSTRELAVIRDKDVVRKATVYGGIVYDTGTDMLTADTVRYGRQRSVFYGLYNLSDSLSVRGGVEYLPATKEEAEYVDDALKGRHIASTLRTDMQATEGAFKDMTGKRNNLLHIATHAFYWPGKEVATADRDFMFMSNIPQRYKEDKAMTRSGLVLAGANNALRGMKLPEDVNDGILTAKEIAQLDLRGLDLVVLSACQTGLGEVTGDGVFGLQRGFKKAGANSLMMSLWNVDDEATSLFMKEFYRQLMAGNGKHESMKAAQRHVREYSEIDEDGEVTHPYENYKYWAAFVLLDAIH
ncbi:MAG: CHAT domain-containing protein [Prevotella sp.]|nr:CHAT domain-containing protein [Prevotella sp.]